MSRKSRSKPEPRMVGVPKRRTADVPFVGFRLVTCTGCGARGQANRGLLESRQYTIPECGECR